MNKILSVILIGLFIISFISVGYFINEKYIEKEDNHKYYQGPVPEGYDEQHFRETGITKPLEINK